jgi:hypothetical protein
MGPKSFPKSLQQDAVFVESLDSPEILPAEAEIHLTIEAEPLSGFRQLAKQIRQYPTDYAFDLNEGINHKAYFQQEGSSAKTKNAKNAKNDKTHEKTIHQYLDHPAFGLGASSAGKINKANATKPNLAKGNSIKAFEPTRIERPHPQTLQTPAPDETVPFTERDKKRTLESLFPVKPFASGRDNPKTKPAQDSLNTAQKTAQTANPHQKATLVRFVSPFQMASEQQEAQGPIGMKGNRNLSYQDGLSLDALNDALSQQFNQRITAKTKSSQPESLSRPTEKNDHFDFENSSEPLHPQQVALMERLADFQTLSEAPTESAPEEEIPLEPNASPDPEAIYPDARLLNEIPEPVTPILRDQFLTRESLTENGLAPRQAPSSEIGMDDSGLDLVLANALLEEALPRPMGTPRVHQRIQDQMNAMDFSTIYRETNWKHLPATPINPTEFFDPDLLDELNWPYSSSSEETGHPHPSSARDPFSQEPLSINYEEATAIMRQHLADLHPNLSIQIDTKPKKLPTTSRFSDTLSPKMEQGSFETQNRGSRNTAPSHPENFVIRGVKLKEIRSMGGNMSNLSGYKDLSKAPAAFGEEEKTDLGQTPFHAGVNSLAASFGPAPGLTHETFSPAEMPATQVAETDYNSNFQTLIRLINELPEGVTKQTGAQIIRLTMESMGIFMEDVLSDAQAAQSEMLDAVRANIKKIEEYKTVIRKLETDIKYYQTKANELSEIIDLFILSNTAGKSGLD